MKFHLSGFDRVASSCLLPRVVLVAYSAALAPTFLACSDQGPGSDNESPGEFDGENVNVNSGGTVASGGLGSTSETGGDSGISAGGTGSLSSGGTTGSGATAGTGGDGGLVNSVPFPDLGDALVLRLETDSGVAVVDGRVSTWADQSGKGNNALQADGSFRPEFVTDGFGRVKFSGKKDPSNTAGEGGTYLKIPDSSSLQWGADDFAILVVASYTNELDHTHSGAFGTFYGKYGAPEILFTGNWTLTETEEESKLHIGFGESAIGFETARSGFNDGQLRLYAVERHGDRVSVRVNGSDEGGANGGDHDDVSGVGVDVGIGSFSGNNAERCLKGEIAAVMALAGDQTGTAMPLLESYLMQKYPLAPLPPPP